MSSSQMLRGSIATPSKDYEIKKNASKMSENSI
jgi:hypothetical protein